MSTIKISERGLERGIREGWYKPNTIGGKCHCGCGQDAPISPMTKRRTGAVQGMPQRYVSGHNVGEIERPRGTAHHGYGKRSSNWRGGSYNLRGYIQVFLGKNHPYRCMASKAGYVPEHRLVMAEFLGRPLTRDEVVHHINNCRDDNRIENLELTDNATNRRYAKERASLAERILKTIEASGMTGEEWLERSGVCGV